MVKDVMGYVLGSSKSGFGLSPQKPVKRTLGERDKKILYRNANRKCQNPKCGKKIEYDEMQVGHKTAFAKGGKTTLKNSVCLCWRCNNLQGTDSWEKFLKKQGIKIEKKEKTEKKKTGRHKDLMSNILGKSNLRF